MRMPLVTLRRGDLLGASFALAVLAILAFVSLRFPETIARYMRHTGQSAEWECQYVPASEPVCIRTPPAGADRRRWRAVPVSRGVQR